MLRHDAFKDALMRCRALMRYDVDAAAAALTIDY